MSPARNSNSTSISNTTSNTNPQSPSLKLPKTKFVVLSVPAPHVLLVTMNLERQMNALSVDACWEMDEVWKWMDGEEEIRVGVLTGAGNKAFSSGMDLKERLTTAATTSKSDMSRHQRYPPTGFGGLTRRVGLKPILAAVNGHAHGGGFELALNADLVFAASHATFRLPDVLRGTAALEGALPRLSRTFGLQRANLLALTGYTLKAREAKEWGLVCEVVSSGATTTTLATTTDGGVDGTDVVRRAVAVAAEMARECSPDSVVVSRAGVREAWEQASVERATQVVADRWASKLFEGDNVKEGLTAFVEKRAPRWKASRL